jgi:signal transduction histidine kinase
MGTDPFEQFAKLGALLAGKAAEIGLTQETFFPIIDVTGQGRHSINVMFILDKALGEPEPEPETDPVLDPILAGIAEATADAEAKAAEEERQQLHELAQAALEEKMRERADRAREMHDQLHEGFLDD